MRCFKWHFNLFNYIWVLYLSILMLCRVLALLGHIVTVPYETAEICTIDMFEHCIFYRVSCVVSRIRAS